MMNASFIIYLFLSIFSSISLQTKGYSTPSSSANQGRPKTIRPSFIARTEKRFGSTSTPPLFFTDYENESVNSDSIRKSNTENPSEWSTINTSLVTDNRIPKLPVQSSASLSLSSVLQSPSEFNMNVVTPEHLKKLETRLPSPLFFADEITFSLQKFMQRKAKNVNDATNAASMSTLSSSSANKPIKPFGVVSPSLTSAKPSLKESNGDNSNAQPQTIEKILPSPLYFANEIITDTSKLTETSPSTTDILSSALTLEQHQEKSIPIASSFQPKEYNPHPLLTNEHLQTILGVFIRDEPGCAYINPNANNTFEEMFPIAKAVLSKLPGILGFVKPEAECNYWDERERIRTNDGDFFDVDYKYAIKKPSIDFDNNGDDGNGSGSGDDNAYMNLYTPEEIANDSEGLVIIVHGLESNSNSSVCTNMAQAFHSHNFDVACINFRGCSGVPNDTIYQYHGGFTQDVTHFIQQLTNRRQERLKRLANHQNAKSKPLYISGFSLGANIVMKCIGELSMDAVTEHNIQGAAVTAAPFHLRPHHRRLIDEPVQRTIYAGSLLKSMKKKLDILLETYLDGDTETDRLDYWKVKNATTIAEVEDGMIAPLYGFKDKFDYFDKSASLPLVDDIAVPTFVLNAADDPFFSTTFFPWGKDCQKGGVSPLKLHRTVNGGHLGHLFHRSRPDEVEELSQQKHPQQHLNPSFALSELGRFIDHVHTNIYKTESH